MAHRARAELSFLQALDVCSSFHPSHNPGKSVLLFPSYGWGDGGTAWFSDLFKAPRPGSSICPEAPCQVAADTQCGSVAEGGRPAGCMCVWLARKLKDKVLIFLTQHLRRPDQSTRCTGPNCFSAGPAPRLWEVLSHLFSFWGASAVLLEDWSEIPGPAKIPALRLTSGLATRACSPLLSTPGTGAGDPG